MELVYTNTVDDLVALQLYFFDHDRGLRRLQNLVSMVPAILILILLFLNSQKGGSSLLILVGMGLAVALALSMRRIIRRRLERSARLSFAHGRGQRTLGKHHLELTEKALSSAQATASSPSPGQRSPPWPRQRRRFSSSEDAALAWSSPASGCSAETPRPLPPRCELTHNRTDYPRPAGAVCSVSCCPVRGYPMAETVGDLAFVPDGHRLALWRRAPGRRRQPRAPPEAALLPQQARPR